MMAGNPHIEYWWQGDNLKRCALVVTKGIREYLRGKAVMYLFHMDVQEKEIGCL